MVTMVMWLTVVAHADAVDAPPECPSGAVGRTGHSGTWCAPQVCTDAPCPDDRTCENTGMCVSEAEVPCGGMVTDTDEPCTFLKREHHGPCDSDDDCTEGTCVVDDYCVEPGGAAAICGCSSMGGASAAFLLGLLPLALARRRDP